MALEDGGIKGEQHFLEPIQCSSENLSPYSSTSSYSDNAPTYYPTDYDWQQQQQQQDQQQQQQHQQQQHHHSQSQQQQQQQQQHPHPHHLQTHHIHESNLRYYGTFTDSLDMSANGGYPNFNAHSLGQTEYFPNNHALWTVSQPDPASTTSMTPHTRFFSGVDLSQQVGGSHSSLSNSSSSSSHGKPKRKRVQTHSQRKAANVRERRRMFHLNEAFDELRKRLPAFNYEKRLSRIETLRLAMTYISFMKEVSVGMDPKCVKLKHQSEDLSGLPLPLSGLGLKHSVFTGAESTDEGTTIDSDDCSSDVNSLHNA